MKPKKFTYWVATCTSDSQAYSARGKTKKEVVDRLQRDGFTREKVDGEMMWVKRYEGGGHVSTFDDVRKHEILYTDLMDLVDNCLGENRGGE